MARSFVYRCPEGLAAVLMALVSIVTSPSRLTAQCANPSLTDYVTCTAHCVDVPDVHCDTNCGALARMSGVVRSGDGGLLIEPVYYGEVFSNTRGGMTTRNATQYQALFDLSLTVDFEKTLLPVPGRFYMLGQNTHGRGLTGDFIGDTLVLSNIDSGKNLTQVAEYWWEFNVLHDVVTLRLGKQDVNTEFFFIDIAEDYIQSSFGLTPTAVLPTFPFPSIAALALVRLDDSLQLKLGVWDLLAEVGSWGVSGNSTVLAIGELEYKYALLDGALPGVMAVGAAYATDGELLGTVFDAGHGYYVQLEQLLFREREWDADAPEGLGVFAAYYPRFLGRQFLDESFGDSFVGGVVYRGLISGRDEDVLGAGVAWAELFKGGSDRETVYEFFYKARITPRVSLQPDIQYIVTPSGIYPDALAIGMRFQVDL